MTALLSVAGEASVSPLRTGSPAPPFDGLLGVDGRRHVMAEFADRALLVLIFSSNRCPTAKAYGGRMNVLQDTYGPRGVQLVAINSNDPHLYPDESFARSVERSAEDAYVFPYLVDDGQRVARAYGATCTFHVFLLDQDRKVRYQGRFDDSRLPERVTTPDLRNAIDDVLAGSDVRITETRPFGCSLDYV